MTNSTRSLVGDYIFIENLGKAIVSAMLISLLTISPAGAEQQEKSLYSLEVESISGNATTLEKYRGKVLLITNIALKCGTTEQLHALQKLYDNYQERGLVVLGFPSNDFTGEDTSEPKEIHNTCSNKYGVTFPLFKPAPIRGEAVQDVFSYLTTSGTEDIQGDVAFNFEKFLIDKKGKLRDRFGPFTGAQSEALLSRVDALLSE